MARFSWQKNDWPQFQFSLESVEDLLFLFAEKQGRVSGILDALPEATRTEAVIDTILAEAIKTSAIEGEFPNRNDVLSSIRNNLGLHTEAGPIQDRSAAGLGELLITVRQSVREPLTETQLFAWHRMLMSATRHMEVGKWRTHPDPMQVVSGPMGNQTIHFEAPPSYRVPELMKAFIEWFNDTAPGGSREIKKAPVRAAITHLYFETIHPFEDGNGRIGRALAEKALSQTIGRPVLLSLSRTIEADRKSYYAALQKAQASDDITQWITYFIKLTLQAQEEAESQIEFTLRKTKFFDQFKNQLNERQLTVVNRMLKEGPAGFEGGMNARKYVGLTRVSKATATRDLQDLLEKGIFLLAGNGKGRSTSYHLNL